MKWPVQLAAVSKGLRNGEIPLLDYVNDLCDLIDRREPEIQALLPEPGRRERLVKEAKKLIMAYDKKDEKPPLYGVITGIKDIVRVEGFPTKAGINLPPQLFDGAEAECVMRLREAGALILGKTVTTEYAYFEPGPTRNPHNLRHTPGGSSSGSAAAVAAGYCPLSVGSQTIGSVIRPASFCGIVGFKPSFDRISREGVLPFSASVDHVGLFTNDVAGMELAAAVVCKDWRDVEAGGRLPVLGVPEGSYLRQAMPSTLSFFEKKLSELSGAGYIIKRVPALSNIAEINMLHKKLIAAELAEVHKDWFAAHEKQYRPRTAELIRLGQEVSKEEISLARESLRRVRKELHDLMEQNGIDLWVAPATTGEAPEGIQTTGDPVMNLPWTHAGLPALTIPAGRGEHGLPLGLQYCARFGFDEQLLSWARKLPHELA